MWERSAVYTSCELTVEMAGYGEFCRALSHSWVAAWPWLLRRTLSHSVYCLPAPRLCSGSSLIHSPLHRHCSLIPLTSACMRGCVHACVQALHRMFFWVLRMGWNSELSVWVSQCLPGWLHWARLERGCLPSNQSSHTEPTGAIGAAWMEVFLWWKSKLE